MRRDLATVAPAFVDMAHGIGMCIVATTGADGRPPHPVVHGTLMPSGEGEVMTWRDAAARSPQRAAATMAG